MKWLTRWGEEILAVLLCSAALLFAGYSWGARHQADTDRDRITQAESKVNTSADDAKAARQALAEVQTKLDAQKRDLQAARLIAQAALDARDATQAQLDKLTTQRETALRKAARETPDCADLARLPVCPAVADKLFGMAPDDPASGGH
jgi:hypothetical protein